MFVKFLKIKAYQNGFVLDNCEGDGPMVTISGEINKYIGNWVNPDTVKPDMGECIYRLELIKADVDFQKKQMDSKGDMYVKLMFANFQKQPYNMDDIMVLHLQDEGNERLEILGTDADVAAVHLQMQPLMKEGIKYLSLEPNRGTRLMLKDCKPHYIETSTEGILQWYSKAIIDQKIHIPTKEELDAEKKAKPKTAK